MEEKQKFGSGGKRANSGRKVTDANDPLKYIQILLPESMIKYIKAQPTSASAFIRLAVKEYIETSAPIPPAHLLPEPPLPLDDADREWGRESARKLGHKESEP